MNYDLENQVLVGNHFTARPASRDDIPHIADHLRKGDRLELQRMYTDTPLEVIQDSFDASVKVWAAYAPDETPVALWGVSPISSASGHGSPWMVGTDRIREKLSDFLWLSRRYDDMMGRRFDVLFNLVDVEYTEARRWLRWLQYEEGQIIKSLKGYDFIEMYRKTNHVRQH